MTMYLLLRFFISMWILFVLTFSMVIQRHKNQLWHRDTNQLVKKYLKNTIPQSQINLIIDCQVISTISEDILKGYRTSHSIIISCLNDSFVLSSISYKIKFIIGIFKTPKDIKVNQWKEFYNRAWNSAARMAIWISDPTNFNDIKKLLETFWQHNSLDVIAITFDILKNTTIIYSYNPFVIKSDNKRGELYEITSNDILYPDKLKNLYGYSIPISLYEYEPHASLINFTELKDGTDVNYCKTLAKWMNFTINLNTAPVDFSSYIISLKNGSKHGVIGDIVNNRSDMLGNSMHWELIDRYGVENAYPYWRSKIVVMVPRNEPLPGICRLFKSGSGITMALIFSALCLLFIILLIKGDNNALLKTLSLMLYQTFGKISRKNSERIFCIAWIYWSLVLISSFQGKLIHDVIAPPYHNDINTLQALYKSNLTIITKTWEKIILDNSYVNNIKQLSGQSIIDINSTKCAIRMMTFKNVACTVDSSHADYALGQIKREIYKKRQLNKKLILTSDIHIMNEPLFYFWRTYVVKKNFICIQKINELSMRLVEFGIIKKWVGDDLLKNFQMTFIDYDAHPLDLEKVQKIFLILICGYTVAIFVFFIEIIYYKFQYKFQYNKCKNNIT